MGKRVESPKIHIVSCRVNEEEMEALAELARRSNVSISKLVRKSLVCLSEEPEAQRVGA